MYKKQTITQDQGRAMVAALVEEFKRAYVALSAKDRQSYNETTVRQKFIDHFFAALGWAITDDDVQLEYAQKRDDDSKGRADYAFGRSAGKSFFVEAKKPYEPLDTCVRHALQARLYGYNADHPVVILTDFEEFSVYLGRGCEPRASDAVNTALVTTLTCKFTDYADKWEVIWDAFSRQRVMAGSLENLPGVQKASKGSKTVDDLFLADIEQWRQAIATDLHRAHPDISRRALNEATQKTIDRIIFLRICEDREIEDYGRLLKIGSQPDIYKNLCSLFTEADARYNSGLFHFKDGADQQHLALQIADAPLQALIQRLYFPGGPYAFAVMPADILGQVYERFLGKVIEITPDGAVAVQDKPEVKKAGGVFYTPEYIVSYIVENTLGQLLAGKTPVDIANLKALDPACGSGAFLINVYQYLLDWHLAWYTANKPEKWAKEQRLVRAGHGPDLGLPGTWQLTLHERKRILLYHVFGVDIDPQAVEVTRLSLLLKCLEGETQRSLQLGLFDKGERILPDLDRNIKCGNSLIGRDFYDPQQTSLFDREAKLRINAFDWEVEFADIMAAGGFDVVVGNPPYVDIKSLPDAEVRYLFKTYACANNRINLFSIFIEKTLKLCNQTEFAHSMIVPTALLTQDSYRDLRKNIIEKYRISNTVRLPNESFGVAAGDVKVDTAIYIFRDKTQSPPDINVITYSGYERIDIISKTENRTLIKHDQWCKSPDYIWSISTDGFENSLIEKIEKDTTSLDQCASICLGLTPYDKYKGHTEEQIKNRAFHADHEKDETFKPLLAGNDVGRYWIDWNKKQWISYGPWLGAARQPKFFKEKRILIKQIIDWTNKRIWATITDVELYNTQNAFNLISETDLSLDYLLGIINSKLMTFFHRKRFLDEFKMRFQKILIKDAKRFPIKNIDFANPAQKKQHDILVQKVTALLALNKELQNPGLDSSERRSIERDMAATDKMIDRLVYQLYDLTEDEIKIIETAVA